LERTKVVLGHTSRSPDVQLIHDCLQWIRIFILSKSTRITEHEGKPLSVKDAIETIETLLGRDGIPVNATFALNQALFGLRNISSVETMQADWRNLDHLASTMKKHEHACKQQLVRMKVTIHTEGSMSSSHKATIASLMEMGLGRSSCWVRGIVLFTVSWRAQHDYHTTTTSSLMMRWQSPTRSLIVSPTPPNIDTRTTTTPDS
jgi:hypothetical protein